MLIQQLTALTLSIGLTLVSQAAAPGPEIHGLEKIPFDQLTHALSAPFGSANRSSLSLNQLSNLESLAQDEREVFQRILELIRETQLTSPKDYIELSKFLIQYREHFRKTTTQNPSALRDSLFVIQMMAEEILYVGSKRFANFPTELSVANLSTSQPRKAQLRDFEIQSGDILLSKATGSGSSSFIALSMSHPHLFSHSTPVYVDEQGTPLSPEAEISDGVKLRHLQKDYIDGSKTRLAIYRYTGANTSHHSTIANATDLFVENMFSKTQGDAFNRASYKYDFSMTPGDAETRGLFCSSVSVEIYRQAGLSGTQTPYSPANWGQASQSRRDLLLALNMNTGRIPAPGDAELNRDFSLVGLRLDISKLEQERIEMAIVDTFLSELNRDRRLIHDLASQIERLGAGPINKEQLTALATHFGPEAQAKLSAVSNVPDSINIKQALFFAFLNEKLTPELRTLVTARIRQIEQTEKRWVGPLEIRGIAQLAGNGIKAKTKGLIQQLRQNQGPLFCSKALAIQ